MLLMVSRRRSPSIRRFVKWTGLTLCAAIWLTHSRSYLPLNSDLLPILIAATITTAVLFWNDQQHSVFAVLAGLLAHSCALVLYGWNFHLGWRRPVQDWMMAHGLGVYAGHYGMFNLFIPDVILSLVGGAFVGFCCYRRWLRCALLFGVTYFALAYIGFTITIRHPPGLTLLLYYLMPIPFAICGAWLVPGKRRRYEAWLTAEGFCKSCRYNLTGNTTGICPECGTPIPDDLKHKLTTEEPEPTTNSPKE